MAPPRKPGGGRRRVTRRRKDEDSDDDMSEPEFPQSRSNTRPSRAKPRDTTRIDSPEPTETESDARAKKQKTGGGSFVHHDSGHVIKTYEDLRELTIPKQQLKGSSSLEWDTKADRPAKSVKTGYADKEKVNTHTAQAPIPLQRDRLIRSTGVASQDQKIVKTELSSFLTGEIKTILNQLQRREKLGHLNDRSRSYTEKEFELDIGRKRDKVVDPKSQQAKTCLNDTMRPFSSIPEIFEDLAQKAESMGFLRACEPFQKQGLQVVTMCSGTESPLIALDLLKRAFKDKSHLLNVRHIASAEIEPFKQAYIQRNFNPEILFRDVTEFCDENAKPHTAFGGTAEQPDKVHMLVAGSSCIDYSHLNNHTKKFGVEGQSFSTLIGITNYCLRMKPAVVILENVDGAPWSQILDMYRMIGYVGLCFKVDTKDFYLPQTRTRGYVVAFHVSKAISKGFNLKEMFETVTASLRMFKQRATVPYTHFIYNDDDPELSIARHKLVNASKGNRESARNWTACRHRYATYRAENQLGFGKPYTQWRPDGSCTPLDTTWVDWVKVQRERIWDTLDVKLLLYLRQRDYDMSYKCRWLELSQNVDRDLDQRHWGLTGCLTPSGVPMDSRRGGPVSGREALALQGIPADKLLLNKENSAQLQDLAGNAMTTTVVGSVIFSAIIASMKKSAINSHRALETEDSIFEYFDGVKTFDPEPCFDLQTLQQIQNAAGRWELQTTIAAQSNYQHPAMTEVARIAASAMQLCRCEGALGKTSSKIAICFQCGHTCCAACRGSPQHDYSEASVLHPNLLKSRATARAFHEYVQKAFPSAIDLVRAEGKLNAVAEHIEMLRTQSSTGNLLKSKFTTIEETRAYLEAIDNSLQHALTFSGIKRDKIIRIIYESSTARLEFQIQFDLTKWLAIRQEWSADLVECTWLLFAKCPKEVGAGSPLRELLETPILKMEPKGFLFDVELEFNTLEEQHMKLMISPHAQLQETAWESSLGIQHKDYQNLQKWPQLQVKVVESHSESSPVVDAISGVYKSLSDCGGANGSLHVKIHPDKSLRGSTQEPQLSGLFLFLDPAPCRNASLDSMVFSSIHERLPYGVPRRVKSVIRPSWRPFQLQRPSIVKAITEGTWKASGLRLEASDRAGAVAILGPKDPTVSIDSKECENYSSIAACHLPRFQHDSAVFPQGRTLCIDIINRPEELKTLQWLLRSKWNLDILGKWHKIMYSSTLLNNVSTCICCPEKPRLKWRLATARDTMIVKPFEDEQAASDYEKKLKVIPSPVKAFLNCHQDELDLDMKLNLDSVVHRIMATLLPGRIGKIDLQWRMRKDHGLETYPVFKATSLPGYKPTDPRISHAPGLRAGCELKPWQKQTAYWMDQQELDNIKWHEFQRLEYALPALEQRLDVEGNKEVFVKGGILADAVGSGKTLTSMVLPAREAATNQGPGPGHEPGLLPLKATIFLIPSSLFNQWKEEKIKHIDSRITCLYIKTYNDLQKYTIKQFQNANFIFVSFSLFVVKTTPSARKSPSYWDQFRKTTNTFNVPGLAGRGFDQWLGEARNDLRDLIAKSMVNGSIDLVKFNVARKDKLNALKTKYQDTFSAFRKAKESEKTEKAEVAKEAEKADKPKKGTKTKPIISKGIAGAAEQIANRQTETYQPAQPQARDDEKGAIDYDADEWSEKDLDRLVPLLHMFSYRRLVVDEFTFLRDHPVSAVIHLSASRRWMLSGTPPLHNYISISYMAKLLGTKITPQGDTDALINFIKANKNLVHDKTSAEEFQQQLESQTPAWFRKRDERAEAFVKRFARQNHREVGEKRKVMVKAKNLSLIESYLYTMAFQYVNGQPRKTEKVDGEKVSSEATPDRDATFVTYHSQKKSAVGAMVWCVLLLLDQYLAAFPKEASRKHDFVILRGLIKEKNDSFGDNAERIEELLAKALKAWQSKQASLRGKAVGKEKGEKDGEDEEEEEEEEEAGTDEDQAVLENKGDGKNCPLAVYLANVLDHNFGDRSVSEVVSRVVKACSLGLGGEVKLGRADGTAAGQKKLATDLNTLTRKAVQIAQERRLLMQVLELGLNQEGTFKCHECERELAPSQLTVMSLCGHLVCEKCLDSESCSGEKLNGCPVLGCAGPGKDSSNSAVRFSPPTSEVKSGGTKVSQLLQVLGTIRRDSPDERVLVFVQDQSKKALVKAIVDRFGAVVADATKGSETAVSKFGKNKDARILILLLDSINAAGWNLQMCNHVVFPHPYLSKTRADWEATMEQAVGRCARFGQQRTVHVYHLLSSATLEMEIFQVRSGGRLVRRHLGSGDEWTLHWGASPNLSPDVVGPRLGSFEDEVEEEGEEREEDEEKDEEE